MAAIKGKGMGRPATDDEPLVRLIASGRTAAESAAAMGCSPSWVWKRMQHPYFAARVQEYRAFSLRRYVVQAEQAAPDFLTEIHAIGTDRTLPERTRLSACRAGLEIMLKLHEAAVVLPRLSVLEALVGELMGESVPLTDGDTTQLKDLLDRLKGDRKALQAAMKLPDEAMASEGDDAADATPDALEREGPNLIVVEGGE